MRCDFTSRLYTYTVSVFQSLLGFLMRCDFQIDLHQILQDKVSIPAGFSDALRLENFTVSSMPIASFQSLLGFLMRCDSSDLAVNILSPFVSIPAGFSDALRRLYLFKT